MITDEKLIRILEMKSRALPLTVRKEVNELIRRYEAEKLRNYDAINEIARKDAEIEKLQHLNYRFIKEASELYKEGAYAASAAFAEDIKAKAEAYTTVKPPDFKPTKIYKISENDIDGILSRLTAGKENEGK